MNRTYRSKQGNRSKIIMEEPECPVCLQVYNNSDTIPRVLPCGHSACQLCLPQLPLKFHNTIRCPACNQLVSYPTKQGPEALPKNIDLLLNNPSIPKGSLKPKGGLDDDHHLDEEALPSFWSDHLYVQWKDWILPQDSIQIQIQSTSNNFFLLSQGKRRIGKGEIVSMLYIGTSILSDALFRYSYTVRLMQFLNQVIHHTARDQLRFLLNNASTNAYGLWMNSEDGSVFFVCESNNNNGDLLGQINQVRNNDGFSNNLMQFAVLGMELCEALSNLHSNRLVCGCLSLSCFKLGDFGHVYVNLNEVLISGRRIRKCIADFTAYVTQRSDDAVLEDRVFVSPELLLNLCHKEGLANKCSTLECSVEHFSDVWPLACIMISLLLEDSFVEELFEIMFQHFPQICEENCDEILNVYSSWLERVTYELETSLPSEFASLRLILCRCLEFQPANRPTVTDVWKCMRALLIKQQDDLLVSSNASGPVENIHHCLTLSNLCDIPKEIRRQSPRQTDHDLQGASVGADFLPENEMIENDIVDGLRIGKFESTNLQAHRDCITSLAVGGGFLFSSSFDKTVHVWSMQDFSHVHAFKGHENRVMGVVFVDAAEPLCISADNGGGLFVWSVGVSLGQEPLKKWNEEKDWRYSGIHALAVSGTDHIYTGSGDKTIKAWSLRDYSLTCTMDGHKSVVSCLAVCDGVVYSGSWDGTIRLWSTNDHSPLTVLGEDTIGNMAPSILSLSVDPHTIAAAHENGCLKLWRNDVLSTSIDTQDSAIFALDVKGKWLFMGGWNKALDVKEILSGDELHIETISVGSISSDSVITALLYCQGKLFVGFADGVIKVYRYVL